MNKYSITVSWSKVFIEKVINNLCVISNVPEIVYCIEVILPELYYTMFLN